MMYQVWISTQDGEVFCAWRSTLQGAKDFMEENGSAGLGCYYVVYEVRRLKEQEINA